MFWVKKIQLFTEFWKEELAKKKRSVLADAMILILILIKTSQRHLSPVLKCLSKCLYCEDMLCSVLLRRCFSSLIVGAGETRVYFGCFGLKVLIDHVLKTQFFVVYNSLINVFCFHRIKQIY